ncbi:MAG: 16S rRNA (cytosine(1402)-N(4))-methyltransferase RsmH [bacterium]
MIGHVPVLYEEVLQNLNPQPGEIFVDGTIGSAGHSLGILGALGERGLLVGLDVDESILALAKQRLRSRFPSPSYRLVVSPFDTLQQILAELGLPKADGILLDVGVHSLHLDTAERGFSFQRDGPLDMRFDRGAQLTAEAVVNTYGAEELKRIFREFGDEPFAGAIARRIERERTGRPLKTTRDLAELIERSVPRRKWPRGIHPATRVFQALRIHVNDELGRLERGLEQAIAALAPGGRLAVITYHSGEHRRVRHAFREASRACKCPPRQPICTCGGLQSYELLTRKALTPSPREIADNPRSRSAQLRVLRRLSEPRRP